MKHGRPIKILQVVPEKLPTFRADVSALFGRYLPRFGVNCAIVGKAASSANEESFFLDETRISSVGPRVLSELIFAFSAVRKAMTIPRSCCDIIQVRDMVSIGALLFLIARLRGCPFVYWMSFLMTEGRVENARSAALEGKRFKAALMLVKAKIEGFFLYRFLLPSADHVFVQSEAMAAFVESRLRSSRELTPVPMGVDLEAIDPLLTARAWQGWEGKQVIVYLGTLDKSRKLCVLVEALAIVVDSHPNARLLFVGTGSQADLEVINAAVEHHGLAGLVAISGWMPKREAWALTKGATLAISPIPRSPIFDTGSPTKIVEYLAMKIPALGNDNPDQKKVLVDSGAGWVCGSRAEDYAEAIVDIFNSPLLASQCAEKGLSYIHKHRSYSVIASGIAAIYHRLAFRKKS